MVSSAGAAASRTGTARGIVDVHAHMTMPSYLALLKDFGFQMSAYGGRKGAAPAAPPAAAAASPPPATGDDGVAIAERLALMDEAGVARQILSTTFAPYFENADHAVAAARHLNDLHAKIAKAHPDRFSCFAALPLPHIEQSLQELDRCMGELGMAGVAIQCFCLDRSVADEHFFPIYEALNQRKATLFFHPCVNGVCSPFINDWGLSATAGVLFEDTTVALHLILNQVPHRYPDIKFIIPHLGGALPMLLDRLDNQLGLSAPGLPEKPSLTARRFWYDSVCHGSKAACHCAVEAFGDDKILPGSDYPILLPFERYAKTFDYIRHIDLPEKTVERILYENMRDIFGPDVDQPLGPRRSEFAGS